MEKEIKCPLCEWTYKVEINKENLLKDVEFVENTIKGVLTRELGKHVYENHLE